MYSQIQIKNFRGFRDLTVNSLQRINLLVAKNNTGKTAFLEAVTLLVNGQGGIQNLPRALRGTEHPELGSEFWSWLFYDRDLDSEISICGRSDGQKVADSITLRCSAGNQSGHVAAFQFQIEGNQRTMWICTEPEMQQPQSRHTPRNRSETTGGVKIFSTNPMNPVEESRKYHKVMLKKGGEEKVQSLLRILEPRLSKIRPGLAGQHPSIYADIGLNELIPVSQLGQGFSRVLSIYSALFLSEATVFLIDEVENGIHYSALDQVWQGLAEVAEQEKVQVFATTHSWECIAAAQRVFANREPYDFAVHRLELVDGKMQVKTYDKETLAASIETKLEVR